jgi:tetratricopeptide (TPR) repeat protein
MDAKSPASQGLSLEPVESAIPAGDAPRKTSDESSSPESAKRDLKIRTSDEFLDRAAKEYQEGQIDQALWRRAADQGSNDASLVIAAYLRARATVLQMQQKQADVSQGAARKPGPVRRANERNDDSEPDPMDMAADTGIRAWAKQPKFLAAGAAALAAVVVVVWLIASPRGSVSPPAAVTAATAAATPNAAPTAPASGRAVAAANPADTRPPFESRVQELKQAGNWNVLVLYASEWTRREPNNATAWYELSAGYAKMRQFDDAFQAAAKATQLAPQDALFWNNLGHVDLSVEHLPEAKLAFDRALAIRADDPDSLCGSALVAQRQGRSSDANAFAARVKAANVGCPGISTVAAVTH